MAVGGKRGSCWCIEFIFVEIWQYFLELTSSTLIRKKLVWTRARWKYKVSRHHICYKDYAHHSGHQEWRWQECPRRLSSQRKDIMTQEEDFVRRSRSGVGSGSTYMHWNRCWSREVPSFHGTDSILSLSVCHKWNGSFTKRLQILIQRNDLRFFPTKNKLIVIYLQSENQKMDDILLSSILGFHKVKN